MKIRLGFVSNSSSTSFCLYGFYTEWKSLHKYLNIKLKRKISLDADGYDYYEWDEQEEIIEHVYKLLKKSCLWYVQAEEGLYIGSDPTTMKDKQTMGNFKQKTKEKISEVFGKMPEAQELEFITSTASTG